MLILILIGVLSFLISSCDITDINQNTPPKYSHILTDPLTPNDTLPNNSDTLILNTIHLNTSNIDSLELSPTFQKKIYWKKITQDICRYPTSYENKIVVKFGISKTQAISILKPFAGNFDTTINWITLNSIVDSLSHALAIHLSVVPEDTMIHPIEYSPLQNTTTLLSIWQRFSLYEFKDNNKKNIFIIPENIIYIKENEFNN